MRCVAVIPARRAERTIGAALESLRIGNAGTVERVVVVTSVGDPTAEIADRWAAHDPGVRVLRLRRPATAGAARNAGRAAAGDPATHLLFLDADCRLEPGGAGKLARTLEDRGAAALGARILAEGGVVATVRHLLEFKEAASRRPPPAAWLPPSTALLCRAGDFDRVGGFPDLWPGEDLVFSARLRRAGSLVDRSDDVAVVHTHPAGLLEMLRHQRRLGFTAAVARRLCAMRGSALAHRPLLAALLWPARMLRLLAWQAGEGVRASVTLLLLSPLAAAGLAVWTLGFVEGVREGRAESPG